MNSTKTVAWICIVGFVVLIGAVVFFNREKLGIGSSDAPANPEA